MSEKTSAELREMYFDAVRRETATPGKYVSEVAIGMARNLCEADGQDPDRMVFGLGGMVPEIGPMQSLVMPKYIAPAWGAYLAMATNVVKKVKETEKAACPTQH